MPLEGDFMYEKFTRVSKKQKIILIIIAAVLVIALTIVGVVLAGKKNTSGQGVKNSTSEKMQELQIEIDEGDPQSAVVEEETAENEIGASVAISDARDDNRTGEITYGIDVSKYQGTIDWQKVAQSGIDFQ